MSCLAGLLAKASESVESELRPRLQGFLGGMVRAYLPQTWVFRTDGETTTLVVDGQGHASVTPGEAPGADVTVQGPHDALKTVLSGGRGAKTAARQLTVTPITPKGRTAFDFLRGRFGM